MQDRLQFETALKGDTMKKVRSIVLSLIVLSAALVLLAGCSSSSSGSSAASSASTTNSSSAEVNYYLVKDFCITTYTSGETEKETTLYEYDESFNKTAKTVNGSLAESWRYDGEGNVIEHVKNGSSYERTEFQFENGLCVREDVYKNGSSNTPQQYKINEYDDAGNLILSTTYDQNGTQRAVVEYTYDGDKLIQEVHNGKLLYEFLYNSDGTHTKRTYYVDKNDGSYFEIVYDAEDRFIVDGDGWTHEREFDSNGKVIRETALAPGGQLRTTEYTREADGSHVTKTVSDFLNSGDTEPYQTIVTDTDYTEGQAVYSREETKSSDGATDIVEEHFYTYQDENGNTIGGSDDQGTNGTSSGASSSEAASSAAAAPAATESQSQGDQSATDELSNTAFSGHKKDFSVSYNLEFHPGHACYLVQLRDGKAEGVSKGSYSFENGTLEISDIPAIMGASYESADRISVNMNTGAWTFKAESGTSDTSMLDSLAESLGPAA